MNNAAYCEDHLLPLSAPHDARVVRIWEPAETRAVIVAIHGGMSHSGDYETVGTYFKKHQLATLSADLTGHGKRRRVDIPAFSVFFDDVQRMLDIAHSHFPGRPVFLMGHSMGALIATHVALSDRFRSEVLHGVILSSPYYANAIPVPPIVVHLSALLAKLLPTTKVPMPSVTEFLTHDAQITARHRRDEQAVQKPSEASLRFGRALLDAQSALKGNLSRWHHPVFAVVAGDDRLADAQASLTMLKTIPEPLLTLHYYPENFHENFNELNRETIFDNLREWMQARL